MVMFDLAQSQKLLVCLIVLSFPMYTSLAIAIPSMQGRETKFSS